MFTPKDIAFMQEKGISRETVDTQIKNFVQGFPYLDIVAAATPAKGINCLSANQIEYLTTYYENAHVKGKCKFVPASGAASRMFKDLFAGLDAAEVTPDSPAGKFCANIRRFAFYDPALFDGKDAHEILRATLEEPGLGYGKKPKGVLTFHKYENEVRTAFAEHLVEAQEYMRSGEKVELVVTVSPEHLELFIDAFEKVRTEYEERYNVQYNVQFTFQDPATDTIAVDEDNKPFRTSAGSLLFRPAGHGALIKNLNAIECELISIKNIDNVSLESNLPVTSLYKKVLMGKALEIRDRIFAFLRQLDEATDETVLNQVCIEAQNYLESELCVEIPSIQYPSVHEKVAIVRSLLNRPIRVCGMVRNEGEPGGGPFIIKGESGITSLQILESVQIDKNNPHAVAMLAGATHFNPVDLVCCVYDYKGKKFDLTQFVDPATGFISSKSFEGRALKALELPGLWNGAMSNWNTAFVEVPVATFNPVKTVLDLLRPAHCSE